MTKADSTRLFDQLEVWDDLPPRGGTLNMALDETLLEALGSRPLLRIYRWAQPTVSFGYFEPWEPVAIGYPHREIVRRWTGGGVVEHGVDLTYSLLVPRSHPVTNLRAGESYRLIHLAVQACCERLGWGRPELSTGGQTGALDPVRACFDLPVRYDLMNQGRKIGGAAQRRTRLGLLHQGSVLPPEPGRRNADIFALTLSEVLSACCSPRKLEDGERSTASCLALAKYATEAWMRRC